MAFSRSKALWDGLSLEQKEGDGRHCCRLADRRLTASDTSPMSICSAEPKQPLCICHVQDSTNNEQYNDTRSQWVRQGNDGGDERQFVGIKLSRANAARSWLSRPEEAKEQINAWVAALTNDLIPTLIGRDALSHLTDLVLANAIYFKAKWNKPFDEERHLFHRLDSTAIDTPFMRGFGRQRIARHNGFKISCDPDFWRKHLPRSDVEVDDFRLPTFKVSFDMTMNDILRDMGLKEALQTGKADLSDVAEDGTGGRRRLALQEVIHRAVIEVNEEGTEAAAATVMITCSTTSTLPPMSRRVAFVADHPFAFFVIEEVSGAIMFAGHVVDPTIN
ncbi:serpin-Z6B-like [Aegilops tauschii subsp. strangulata]|uniref:serpin-Z6B-like n=1 Tax=Aegilops tauschii subsp. strangulata TaxID=200361 RepID=UPI003CC8B035